MLAFWKRLMARTFDRRRAVRSGRKLRPASPRFRLGLESMEDRLVPNTYTVTSTTDSGVGSLRTGLQGLPAVTTIDFDIPTTDSGYNAATGVWTISLQSKLPSISSAVFINGESQPGYAAAGHPVVELDGASAGNSADGLLITGAGSTVQGLDIDGFGNNGIEITGNNNTIVANYLGTNAAGTTAVANANDGIEIDGGATGNTVGGATAAAGNLISGNTNAGVQIDGNGTTNNAVENNPIGINAANTAAIANGIDVLTSGGTTGNLIEGNTQLQSGSWTEYTDPNNGDSFGTMDLLPNGQILISGANAGVTNNWFLLTPDQHGSYLDGTLTDAADSSLQRLYTGEVVLPNDDVMIYGGEYSGPDGNTTWVNSGEMYDPSTNTWTNIATIPNSLDAYDQFGDDPLEVLPDGDVIGGYLAGPQTFIYDPSTNVWSAGPTKMYNDQTDEEAWAKVPGMGGDIVDYAVFASNYSAPGKGQYLDNVTIASATESGTTVTITTSSPIPDLAAGQSVTVAGITPAGYDGTFNISSASGDQFTYTAASGLGSATLSNTLVSTWVATGSVPVALSEQYESELGPAVLMPSIDKVFQIGANGESGSSTNTALYDPITNTWEAGPVIPGGFTADDAAAAVLPDSNVILDADQGWQNGQEFSAPSEMFEFNGTAIVPMTVPAALHYDFTEGGFYDNGEAAYVTRMLDLPTGQVAFVNGSNNIWFYQEDGSVNPSWAPTITSIVPAAGNAYTLTGTQLNGMDEGAAYGDDANMATNYPIVQLTDAAGDVYDATTFNWSSEGVSTGNTPVSTEFNLPAGLPAGTYQLTVEANGIASASDTVIYNGSSLTFAPDVSGVSPDTGPIAGGQLVTITGSAMAGATAVDFGSDAATIESDTSNQIVVKTPVEGAGTVDVTVTTVQGTSSIVPQDQYTYVAVPVVSGVNPVAGPEIGGATVTITGTFLANATAVDFGTTPATLVSDTSTQLVVTTNAASSSGVVDVTVITAGGTSLTSAADQYTFVTAPTVTGVSPKSGPGTGGESITITGTNLANAAAVDFGGLPSSIVSDTATQIVVLDPSEAQGTVDVTVTTAGGTSSKSASDQFIYESTPVVLGVSPSIGPAYGGSTITITGLNLAAASAVDFGTLAGTIVSDSAGKIVVTDPAEGAGTVDVTVTTAGGTSPTSGADQYTYIADPTVTSVSPPGGPLAGGNTVTITGTNLGNAVAVDFGGVVALPSADTGTQLVVTAPAGAAGSVDVTVTTQFGGTSATSSADKYAYVPIPIASTISPTDGPASGGATVTITGTNLANALAVDFGTTPAIITSDSNTQIVVTTPLGAPGKVYVTVTTYGGTTGDTLAMQYTYIPAPIVSAVTPAEGSTAGGTTVTITGSNFSGASIIDFGSVPGSILSDSATAIVALSPVEAAGTVDVVVTTIGGPSGITNSDHYTVVPVPAVTALAPPAGPLSGGAEVTVTGTAMANATAVTFGSVTGTIIGDTSTQIIVVSPAESAGTVDVTVTTQGGGTSALTPVDKYTFVPIAVVTGVSPTSGPLSGGIPVTITGSNLAETTGVDFGSQAATVVSDTATQLVVDSPGGTAGTVDVTVTTSGGTSATSVADRFTTDQADPTFSGLTSSSITYGTANLIISGTLNPNAGSQTIPANEIVDVTLAGVTQLARLTSTDTFSTTFVTGQLPVSGSPYTITFNYYGDNNYTATSDTSTTLTVTALHPAFTNLSAPAIAYGTASTTITGTLTAPGGVPAGEPVTVSLDGVLKTVSLDADDNFSATFNTAALTTVGSPYTIAFGYNGDTNLAPSSGSSSLTVSTATVGFTDLSDPTITAGTASTSVSGTLTPTSGGLKVPANEIVQVTLNGITQTASLSAGDTFSTTFNTAALTATGSPYTIGFKYAGDAEFGPATGGSTLSVTSYDVATSTVSVSAGTLAAGTGVTVTLEAKDAAGGDITSGGLSVVFGLASGSGGQGTFSAVTDMGNGTYTATFSGTLAGNNSITATINTQAVTSTPPAVTITPGVDDPVNAVITVTNPTVAAGTTDTVTLQARDAFGNDLTTGGLTVAFGLDSGSGGQGTFSVVTDHGNGTYSAAFSGTTAGANNVSATVGGQGVGTGDPAVTVTPGVASAANSIVTLSTPPTQSTPAIQFGGQATLTIQTRDAFGNDETTGGLTVAVSAAAMSTAQGALTPVTDHKNGTYTATFLDITDGTVTFDPTIVVNGTTVKLTTTPSLNVVGDAVNAAKSKLTIAAATVTAGNTTTVTFQAEDAKGVPETAGGLLVTFELGSSKGGQGTLTPAVDNGNGTYTATFEGTTAGTNTIKALIAGTIGSPKAAAVKVVAGAFSWGTSTVTASATTVKAGGKLTVTLHPEDAFGNKLSVKGLSVAFGLAGTGTGQGNFTAAKYNATTGTYTATFTATTVGATAITATVGGQELTSTPVGITVLPGAASAARSVVTLPPASAAVGVPISITLRAEDADGNDLTAGGLTVKFMLGTGSAKGTFGKVIDNKNGTYTVSFIGTAAGTASVIATIGGVKLTSLPATITVTA